MHAKKQRVQPPVSTCQIWLVLDVNMYVQHAVVSEHRVWQQPHDHMRSVHSLSVRCFATCGAVHHGTLRCRTGVCAVEMLLVPVTTSGLVNHGNIMCSSFIMLDISSIHKVKLSIIHQLAHQVFCGLGLFPPPACKERLQTMLFWAPIKGYTIYAEPSMG